MQRIRKEDGIGKIKIVIEKEGPVDDVEHALADIQGEITDGFALLVVNYPHFDEVRIDKHGDMFTKKKREIPTPLAKK